MVRSIILLGPPGSGKNTQAEALVTRYGLLHLETGDVFRELAKKESTLGRMAKHKLDRGELIPDGPTKRVVTDWFVRHSQQITRQGLILNGFPRTPGQIDTCDGLLDEYRLRKTAVIFLDTDWDICLQRLPARRRSDDREKQISRRFADYEADTMPVVNHYQKWSDSGGSHFLVIPGDQPPETVTDKLTRVLDPLVKTR